MNRNSIQFNILFKSHLLNTGHNTQIKQSYNNKLESHSLQNYKRLSCIIKTVFIAQIYKTLNITSGEWLRPAKTILNATKSQNGPKETLISL